MLQFIILVRNITKFGNSPLNPEICVYFYMATPANQETITKVKEIFRNYLKDHNHRQTPERIMVLEEIYLADGHFDADDIYFRM